MARRQTLQNKRTSRQAGPRHWVSVDGVGTMALACRSGTSATVLDDTRRAIVMPVGAWPVVKLPWFQLEWRLASGARAPPALIHVRSPLYDTIQWEPSL